MARSSLRAIPVSGKCGVETAPFRKPRRSRRPRNRPSRGASGPFTLRTVPGDRESLFTVRTVSASGIRFGTTIGVSSRRSRRPASEERGKNMGIIRGDLSVLSLANLVQVLVLDRSVGLLTLESGSERRVLRISPTGVRLVRGSQRCHRLERVLRRTIAALSKGNDEFSVRIGRLVREWMHEEICELFTWLRGTFMFEKAELRTVLDEGPFR